MHNLFFENQMQWFNLGTIIMRMRVMMMMMTMIMMTMMMMEPSVIIVQVMVSGELTKMIFPISSLTLILFTVYPRETKI